MARAFSEIAFTPTVRAAQARQGSAGAYEKFLALDEGRSQAQGIQARARIRTLKKELENKR